jgi:hypothetical protein
MRTSAFVSDMQADSEQYPFEFAKTKAQLKSAGVTTTNPISLISQTVRSQGVGAIYAGCSTLVVVSRATGVVWDLVI